MSSGCTRSYLEYRQRRRWPKTLSPCPQPQAQMVLSTPALALLAAPLALAALALLVAPLVLVSPAPPALAPLVRPVSLLAP